MEKERAFKIATKLQKWMSNQKYGDEELLHAAVCCDHVGRVRFIKAITEIIEKELNEG